MQKMAAAPSKKRNKESVKSLCSTTRLPCKLKACKFTMQIYHANYLFTMQIQRKQVANPMRGWAQFAPTSALIK